MIGRTENLNPQVEESKIRQSNLLKNPQIPNKPSKISFESDEADSCPCGNTKCQIM